MNMLSRVALVTLVSVVSLWTDCAAAQTKPHEDKTQYLRELPNASDMFGKMIGSTVFVLIAAVVTILVAKRWMPKFDGTQSRAGILRRIDSLALNKNCSIHLIDTDAGRVLVGTDQTGLKSVVMLPGVFADAVAEAERDGASLLPLQSKAA